MKDPYQQNLKWSGIGGVAMLIYVVIVILNAVITHKTLFTRRPIPQRECAQVWCK